MAKLPVFSKEEPSEIIKNLVDGSGSTSITCEQCGRVHYDWRGEGMDGEELKDLEEKANKNSDKYIGHDGFPSWGNVMNKQTVVDCPCNFLSLFEKEIWSDRHLISDYLIQRAGAVLERAKDTARKASQTKIVKKT